MAEYIERKQLIGSLEDVIADYRYDHTFSTDFAATVVTDILNNIVKCQPAADVAPVVHGRWERTADGAALCTACKRKTNPSQYGYAFCGLCGARMDGD